MEVKAPLSRRPIKRSIHSRGGRLSSIRAAVGSDVVGSSNVRRDSILRNRAIALSDALLQVERLRERRMAGESRKTAAIRALWTEAPRSSEQSEDSSST